MVLLYSLQADELEYAFKRLVDGLAHTREAARPGFSLALGQVRANHVLVLTKHRICKQTRFPLLILYNPSPTEGAVYV